MSFVDLISIAAVVFWIVLLSGFFTYRIVRLILRQRAREYQLRERLASHYRTP